MSVVAQLGQRLPGKRVAAETSGRGETGVLRWLKGVAVRSRYGDVSVHLALILVVAGTWRYSEDPVLTLYLGGFLVAPLYLGLMAFEMRRSPVLLSPLSFYFLWYSLGLGLAALSIAGRIAAHDAILLSSFEVRPEQLASGYVLMLAGSVAFHFGVQTTRPLIRSVRATNGITREGSRRYSRALLLIWTLGVGSRLFASPTTIAGALFGILVWASNAALCAYCLSTSRSKPRLSWTILFFGCLVELACNLQSFSKAYIMYSFVPVLWTLMFFRSYRIWLIPSGVAFVLFYLSTVAPVVLVAREEGRLSEGETYAGRLLKHYGESSPVGADLGLQLEKLFERQFDPISTGFIHGEVEKYGLRYGEELDYLAYAFIPRLVWPEKPTVTRGAWFTMYLGGASSEAEATTATALTAAGELYWNFGTWGVIAGMILVGALVGVMWRVAGASPQVDPLRMLLYFNCIIAVVDNAEAGVMVVGIVHRILLLGSIIWLWDLRIRRLAAERVVPAPQTWDQPVRTALSRY